MAENTRKEVGARGPGGMDDEETSGQDDGGRRGCGSGMNCTVLGFGRGGFA